MQGRQMGLERNAVITSEFAPDTFFPVVLGLLLTTIIWHFWVPRSLRRIQIAFHTGGDDYEVHRISESVKDARDLLGIKGAGWGVLLYIMAITGVMILCMEILIKPFEHSIYVFQIIAVLIGIPVMISPVSSMAAQFSRTVGHKRKDIERAEKRKLLRFLLGAVAIAITVWFVNFWLQESGAPFEQIAAFTLLIMLLPSIIAYGRILGSCWNVLVHSKYHRAAGRVSILYPDAPGMMARIMAMLIFLNAVLMPLTALNGVISWVIQFSDFSSLFVHSDRVVDMEGYQNRSLLGEGGIIGYYFIEMSWYIDDFTIRNFATVLVILFLLLNVTIVGIAFVYEVARLMFLGASHISGRGGIVFAQPRTLRSETSQQARILQFCFMGFAGYTVLLLLISLFHRFPQFLPDTSGCSDWVSSVEVIDDGFCPVFEPDVLEQLMFTLSVSGQAVFFIVWLLSINRAKRLTRLKFDLNSNDLEEKAKQIAAGDVSIGQRIKRSLKEELHEIVAADKLHRMSEVLKMLERTDDRRDRLFQSKAQMLHAVSVGRWRNAEERATSVLAQQKGKDDLARKVLAMSAIAQRDLREAESAIEDLDRDDIEVALMLWIIDLFRTRSEGIDNLKKVTSTPAGRRVIDLMERYSTWFPWSAEHDWQDTQIERLGIVSDIGLLRLHGQSQLALDIIENLQRGLLEDGTWLRLNVAQALVLIDLGRTADAMIIHTRLVKGHSQHPCVAGLTEVMRGQGLITSKLNSQRDVWIPEVVVATDSPSLIEWGKMIDDMPCNAVAALRQGKSGIDEALVANAWVTAGVAAKRGVHPSRKSPFTRGFGILLLGIVTSAFSAVQSPLLGLIILVMAILLWDQHVQMNRNVRLRNMPALRKLSRRLRRKKAMVRPEALPPGTHLLLKGFILPLNGIPVDVGFPAWISPKRKMKEGLVPKNTAMKGHLNSFRQSLRTIGVRLDQLRPSILTNSRNSAFKRKRGTFGEASLITRRVTNARVLTAPSPGGPPLLNDRIAMTDSYQAVQNPDNLVQFVSRKEKRFMKKQNKRSRRKGRMDDW
ncbi:MAG: hypothetical protein HOA04_08620 [Euryarchaeota archaeon]|nr:hypothetical protein [Euryarchaeota archaeon]